MTDFVGVGSLSKVELFFLSGIRKINWSGIAHSDSQKPGFLPSVRAPTGLLVKKPGFGAPCVSPICSMSASTQPIFREDFSLRQGYFYQLSGLGHLLNEQSFAGMTRKCQN
jgi:hypothetical protein